jgi:hypothetical protein
VCKKQSVPRGIGDGLADRQRIPAVEAAMHLDTPELVGRVDQRATRFA